MRDDALAKVLACITFSLSSMNAFAPRPLIRKTFNAGGHSFGSFCRNSSKIVTVYTAGNDFNDFIVSDFTTRLYNSDGYEEGLS